MVKWRSRFSKAEPLFAVRVTGSTISVAYSTSSPTPAQPRNKFKVFYSMRQMTFTALWHISFLFLLCQSHPRPKDGATHKRWSVPACTSKFTRSLDQRYTQSPPLRRLHKHGCCATPAPQSEPNRNPGPIGAIHLESQSQAVVYTHNIQTQDQQSRESPSHNKRHQHLRDTRRRRVLCKGKQVCSKRHMAI